MFSVALYFFPRRNSSLPSSVRIILALLRFLAVSLLAFLLLSPLVRRNVNTREKPIVVIAQDASQSVDLSTPLFNRSTLRSLQSDYDVVLDTFGGATTDISSALSSIADRYMGRNLGAVVLASDGIYNQGINPSLTASSFTVPVYTVALGDTTTRCDAAIAHVRYNRIAYLGNQFPLEVTLRAVRLKGSRATLTVTTPTTPSPSPFRSRSLPTAPASSPTPSSSLRSTTRPPMPTTAAPSPSKCSTAARR